MGILQQESWSGLPCSPPGDLPNPRLRPPCLMSPALAGGFFTSSHLGSPSHSTLITKMPCLVLGFQLLETHTQRVFARAALICNGASLHGGWVAKPQGHPCGHPQPVSACVGLRLLVSHLSDWQFQIR